MTAGEDPGTFARGVRLGVDVGKVRIGVAISDPDGILASPLVTLGRDRRGADLSELANIVAERSVVEVVVGLPLLLSGAEGAAVKDARRFADRLRKRIAPVPVRFVDERLTTVSAIRMLRDRGVRGGQQRAVVDQAAAVEILRSWLETRRDRSAKHAGPPPSSDPRETSS